MARHRGPGAWVVALVAGPLLRPDLDVMTAHPEDYATGAWAPVMQVGYLGAALAGMAAAWLGRRRPVAAALLALFAAGTFAIGLLPPTSSEAAGSALADTVFPYLQLSPLAFFPAIAWLSWRERQPTLLALAALAWLLFVPLVIGEWPNDAIVNRAADVAMAGWLVAFALTVGRGTAASAVPAAA